MPPDNDGFSCFEILGFDVMLDRDLDPWLIEVNHSPSFNVDSILDLTTKEALISQTLDLVRVDPRLVSKAKRLEKRAASERLLAGIQPKKQPAAEGEGAEGEGAAPKPRPAAARTAEDLQRNR